MAIDRAPFNALVDDDGSNLVGSVWNKAAIAGVILDPVDAALSSLVGVIPSTQIGAINDWAPAGLAGKPSAVILWTGASDAAITGMAGGVAGQQVTIQHGGAAGAVLTLAHTSTSSAAAHRFVNVATSAPTPIARNGWATYVHSGVAWVLVSHEQGAWITPPFVATDYYGLGGITWTITAGNINLCRYRLSGRTLQWEIVNSGSALGGTASATLARKVPGGFSCVGNSPGCGWATNSTSKLVLVQTAPTEIYFQLGLNYPNWVLSQVEMAVSSTIDVT